MKVISPFSVGHLPQVLWLRARVQWLYYLNVVYFLSYHLYFPLKSELRKLWASPGEKETVCVAKKQLIRKIEMSFCPSGRYTLKYCGKCSEIYSNFFSPEDIGTWSSFFPYWVFQHQRRCFWVTVSHSSYTHFCGPMHDRTCPHHSTAQLPGVSSITALLLQGVLQTLFDSVTDHNASFTEQLTKPFIIFNKTCMCILGGVVIFMTQINK